ncbi:MAG: glycerate kinase [Clostridia bacterium]|nr:glycerate kinase [Clostridia bacterium]
MRIAVAIDSFKGSLSTFEAGEAVKEGVLRIYSDAEVLVCPLADGGEGTMEAIVSAVDGARRTVEVSDPIGRRIKAIYGILPQSGTAVIEMSAAAGLTLLSQPERDPLNTTTFGVGEMILDAIDQGCRRFILGIGGSATNDGGVGMLEAFGYRFLDRDGRQIVRGGVGLEALVRIDADGARPELSECQFFVACDVENPLCGDRGCSAVYGPQKGATPEAVKKMDAWLANYARLTREVNPRADEHAAGAGAAGGMGFACLSYLGATLRTGVELVMEATGLEAHLSNADLVVTGEGRLDAQTCMGKAPIGVARCAKRYGKPVVAFSGCVSEGARACNENGIDAYFPILRSVGTLEEAMDTKNAYRNLADTAEQVFRLISAFKNA